MKFLKQLFKNKKEKERESYLKRLESHSSITFSEEKEHRIRLYLDISQEDYDCCRKNCNMTLSCLKIDENHSDSEEEILNIEEWYVYLSKHDGELDTAMINYLIIHNNEIKWKELTTFLDFENHPVTIFYLKQYFV